MDLDLLEPCCRAGYVCGAEDEPKRERAPDGAVLVQLGAGKLDDGFVAASHHGLKELRRWRSSYVGNGLRLGLGYVLCLW